MNTDAISTIAAAAEELHKNKVVLKFALDLTIIMVKRKLEHSVRTREALDALKDQIQSIESDLGKASSEDEKMLVFRKHQEALDEKISKLAPLCPQDVKDTLRAAVNSYKREDFFWEPGIDRTNILQRMERFVRIGDVPSDEVIRRNLRMILKIAE